MSSKVVPCVRGSELLLSEVRREGEKVVFTHYLGSDFKLLPAYATFMKSQPRYVEGDLPVRSKVGAFQKEACYKVVAEVVQSFGGLSTGLSLELVLVSKGIGRTTVDTLPFRYVGLDLSFLESQVSSTLEGVLRKVQDESQFWSIYNKEVAPSVGGSSSDERKYLIGF